MISAISVKDRLKNHATASGKTFQEVLTAYGLESGEGQRIPFCELGVGGNTQANIKYFFWAMTAENLRAIYACLNYDEVLCPIQIGDRFIFIAGDVGSGPRHV